MKLMYDASILIFIYLQIYFGGGLRALPSQTVLLRTPLTGKKGMLGNVFYCLLYNTIEQSFQDTEIRILAF
jgi:hypothetical protein